MTVPSRLPASRIPAACGTVLQMALVIAARYSDTGFGTCKSNGAKKCKKKRKRCKKDCDAKPNLCPACEDNTIPGFGTSWCEMNVNAAGFCSSSDGTYKCKKTCGLCR